MNVVFHCINFDSISNDLTSFIRKNSTNLLKCEYLDRILVSFMLILWCYQWLALDYRLVLVLIVNRTFGQFWRYIKGKTET